MKDNSRQIVYWSRLEYDAWNLYMAATSQGLCYVGSPDHPFKELTDWAGKRFLQHDLVRCEERLQQYKSELVEFFQGKRQFFSFPMDIRGTSFQQEVWNALYQIPYGETYTYTQIAELIGKPSAVRAVGTAIGANPLLISIPCHRVLGKNGTLTGYRGGLDMKKQLLHIEGKWKQVKVKV
ncbi:methylated-DNA--[protein]-cysteine S-methyltransferase [Kroppenstedtia pulmonis]|uniref:methylated-DNA--[protein]-cysteine S-methyltransferase n=1 Tax=Kroppenstedtia pulmonis TaxID=1380685 RepID=A0A7D3XQV2_9BACL|nr:methylated-DNA--[protein]-cysteine S-methyltransferase [Kroppenstedtia pulmonis]QKG83808.1 methylated-DNA--[protein]-cysteine S-methyltransferase [Kroppenstedtia pulmonis]